MSNYVLFYYSMSGGETKRTVPIDSCFAMKNLSSYQICGHVHDELIIECPEDTNVSTITSVMSHTPSWMHDILIRGDGYETPFYKKD